MPHLPRNPVLRTVNSMLAEHLGRLSYTLSVWFSGLPYLAILFSKI